MTPDVVIMVPNALLAFGTLSYPKRYFDYMFAHYTSGQLQNQVWHRTLMMDHNDWIQLGGHSRITPPEALWSILTARERHPLPLPAILVAGFVALTSNPGTDSQRDLFYWISSGVSDLLHVLPPVSLSVDADPLPVEQRAQLVQSIIGAILREEGRIPWPDYDADGFTVLLALAAYLWSFPPNLVSSLVTAQLDSLDAYRAAQDADDEDESVNEADEEFQKLTPASLLRNLSAMHIWQTPSLTMRGLPIQMPYSAYDLTWTQALVLTYPDAPHINDADLDWLCEGGIGNEEQRSGVDFVDVNFRIEQLSICYATQMEHINALQAEAVNGTYSPIGKWTFQVNEQMAVLSALRVYAVRLVAGPTGCWVRLISHPELWGRVLWWQPQEAPPICMPLLFHTTRTSPAIMALHETLWELWRDLRVTGNLLIAGSHIH